MNDDDLTALASAYLDDEATPSERARVDADAGLAAEVERLREVRDSLRATEPAPISVRERHLAAALDAWDRLPAAERAGELRDATPPTADAAAAAGAATITAPASITQRRARRRSGRYLAVAAGFVVVLGGGLVVRNLAQTSSDDTVATVHDAPAPADADARAEIDDAAADETFGTDAAEELFFEERVGAPEAESGSVNEADTFIGSDEGSADDDLEVLGSNEELAIFAGDGLAALDEQVATADVAESGEPAEASDGADAPAAAAPEPDAVPFPLCGLVDIVVGPARWDTPGLFDDVVVVGIDFSTDEAVAYRADDCVEVARTALPSP